METPETDSTYAHSYMYVTDGSWVFIAERAADELFYVECIGDILDYCQHRDSTYYDDGIITPTQHYALGSLDMLYREGRRSEYPDNIFTSYDLLQDRHHIAISIIYPAEEYGKPETRRRVEALLSGIELD